MKIAVTYENGQVFQHFGHTAQFKLYDVENGTVHLTRRLVDASEALCEGRLVSVLEGGYSLRSLARSVLVHLQMLGRNRT